MYSFDSLAGPTENPDNLDTAHGFIHELYNCIGNVMPIDLSDNCRSNAASNLPNLELTVNIATNDGVDKFADAAKDKKTFDPEEVDQLVQKLGDPTFNEREKAEKQLVEKLYGTGIPGVRILTDLLRNEADPEIRARLHRIIPKLTNHPDLWQGFAEQKITNRVENTLVNLAEADKQVYREFANALIKADVPKLIRLISWNPETLNGNSLIFRELAGIMNEELDMTVKFFTSDPDQQAQDPSVREASGELQIGFVGQVGKICIAPEKICEASNVGVEVRGKLVSDANPSELYEKMLRDRFESRKKGEAPAKRSKIEPPNMKRPPRPAGLV